MALTIGGVTIPNGEKPYDVLLSYSGAVGWAKANPYGYTGKIMRVSFTDAKEHLLKMYLLDATRASIQALVDADPSANRAFVWNDGDLTISQTVTIEKFTVRRNPLMVTTLRYDCELLMVVV
jgi:hypothetical protein